MKTKKFRFIFMLIFVQVFFELSAQESLLSAGNTTSNQSGSVCYSVGQVFFNVDANENGSVQQGVQQTYEIKVFTERGYTKGIQLECTVYPNPTSDFLVLKMNDFKVEEIAYNHLQVL